MSDEEYTASDAVSDGQEGVDEQGVPGYAQGAVIGGSLAALATALAEIILGIPGTFLQPVEAFASGFATFIGGTLGAPITITDAGATASATSFLEGTGALLGPFAFPLAVAVSVAGVFVFFMFLRRISVSPTQLIRERRS